MKIVEIRKEDGLYIVKQTPTKLERMFGRKEKETKYKCNTWKEYMFGGGSIYYNHLGEELGNGHKIGVAIDNWRRSF